MTNQNDPNRPDRPPLPQDAFRGRRIGAGPERAAIKPVVVTPAYADPVAGNATEMSSAPLQTEPKTTKTNDRARPGARPFEAYGERSSSRPYALRLPDAIDLALRKIAAEERTHPLRIIDRILYEHLETIGRLPPIEGS
jgi:hypothetical protein